MKFLILSLILSSFVAGSTFGKAKEVKKSLDIKGHVSKLKPSKGHFYWFNLHEFSNPYYADEKFVPCLEKSMTDNKVASLTVNNTLVVLKCNVK